MKGGFQRSWFGIAIFNFSLAAVAGLIMRIAFVFGLSVLSFKNLLQSHSHLALLGWLYIGIIVLLRFYFLRPDPGMDRKISRILLLTEVILLLMFGGFLVAGYSLLTISLLVAHIILVAVIVRLFILHSRENKPFRNHSRRWLLASFIFLLASFLGPMALGPINALDLHGSIAYYIAIQFFLHFQFNGWLLFVLMAIFFRFLEVNNLVIEETLVQKLFHYMVFSCILSFALGIAWSTPHFSIYLINSLAVILQLLAAWYFVRIIRNNSDQILEIIDAKYRWLFLTSLYCFFIKIFIQTLVVLPLVADISFTIRWYVIGFLHLILLGVISFGILAFALQSKSAPGKSKMFQLGLFLFMAGFVASEFLLFGQGTLVWVTLGYMAYFHEGLLAATIFLTGGIIAMLFGQLKYILEQRRTSIPVQ